MSLIHADHVSKWYGQVIGLNDVTLTVPPGITGLLGPNGAGKSTFMKLVTGQLKPSKGTLTVSGDSLDNTIVVSRDAAGQLLVRSGAVRVLGGTPTVANAVLIRVFGQAGNDRISLDEANGPLPPARLFGGTGAEQPVYSVVSGAPANRSATVRRTGRVADTSSRSPPMGSVRR